MHLKVGPIQIRLLFTWILYYAYFRGVIAFYAGYVITFISINLAVFLILIPPMAVLLPIKSNYNWYLLLATTMWLGGIMINLIILKLLFLTFGTAFTFIMLKLDFEFYNHKNFQLFPFIFFIDQLIRAPNNGQDPFIDSNLRTKFFTIIISLILVSYLARTDFSKDVPIGNAKSDNWKRLKFPISLFIIFVIYTIELAGPGLLVLNGFTTLRGSILLNILVYFIFGYIVLFIRTVNPKYAITFGIILGFSIYYYPWYGFTIVLWFLAIFILLFYLKIISSTTQTAVYKVNSRNILIGHYIAVGVMFYGLVTESYIIIPILSVILGMLVWSTFRSESSIKYNFTFPNIKNKKDKLILVFLLSLFISPFLSLKSPDSRLEATSDLRLMTFNLHFGISGTGEDNIKGVVNIIKSNNPTIVAFQEVTLAAAINGYDDMFSNLKSSLGQLGYEYSYFSEGGKYQTRNAIFSKEEIVSTSTYLLDPRVIYERSLIEIVIRIDDKLNYVYVAHVTHVEEENSNPDRIRQIDQIMDILTPYIQTNPVFLLGDFNAEPDWPEIESITSRLTDTWRQFNSSDDGFTWPYDKPKQRIDYIFNNQYYPLINCELVQSSVSDHLPLLCNFQV